MQEVLSPFLAVLPALDAPIVALIVLFGSVLLTVFGTVALLAPKDAIQRRFEQAGNSGTPSLAPIALRQIDDQAALKGWQRYITPQDEAERSRMRLHLARAGYRAPSTLRNYYLIRTALGLGLSMPVVAAYLFMSISLSAEIGERLNVSLPQLFWLIIILVAVGFYAPPLWVRHRIAARQRAVREGFPDALDMLLVSVEAGLGLDAALGRVAVEIGPGHPIIAEELSLVVLEIRAGKRRDEVLHDMATRIGVDEVSALVTVLVQSNRFGTSVADALRVYASEMRTTRLLRAEERANKLPVKLSIAVVLCMLPAMFAVILGPIAIRVIRTLAPALTGGG